jgi:hypothetical protein
VPCDVGPAAQPVDHVGAHAVVQHEPRRRAPACACILDVASVRCGDRRERRVVGEPVGEGVKNRSTAASSTAPSSIAASTAAVTASRAAARAAAVTCRSSPGGLVDEQRVAGREGLRDRHRYRHDPVTAEDDRLTGVEALEDGRRSRPALRGGCRGSCEHGRGEPTGRHPHRVPAANHP